MSTTTPNLRQRRRALAIPTLLLVGVLFTLGTSAAQIIPVTRPPSNAQVLRDDLAAIARARWARIGELRTERAEERCAPAAAHELAKLLVMDGQWDNARAFGAAYEARCGEDPEVQRWANAPQPRPRP